jgi:hypothetical protein
MWLRAGGCLPVSTSAAARASGISTASGIADKASNNGGDENGDTAVVIVLWPLAPIAVAAVGEVVEVAEVIAATSASTAASAAVAAMATGTEMDKGGYAPLSRAASAVASAVLAATWASVARVATAQWSSTKIPAANMIRVAILSASTARLSLRLPESIAA